jgi:lysophospholipase L1-like esterase
MKRLVLFGDSMLANFGSDQIELLESRLKDIEVYNCAAGGSATKHGLSKVKYIATLKPEIVILSFGINDLFKYKLSVSEYIGNLAGIVDEFKGSRVIIWLTPKGNDLKDIEGSIDFNNKISQFNAAVKEYCKGNKREYIDSFSEYDITVGEKDPYHEEGDGIHLTDDGYNLFIDSIVRLVSK